ncbi:hypothetical protein NDU88_005233 [Pleurodeles waltl]|uniref:Uncharacterized protein n=1 Tax=Pleurodeles waltl TaxID=8319 RepID=A0AAV7UI64_PLEWA|nr:hypothetical protein NDU88_005233 [Pleurodeles waltl]
MRRARARVLNGRRRPLRDAVSEGQKKGRAFPYNNRALNTQVSQCNGSAYQGLQNDCFNISLTPKFRRIEAKDSKEDNPSRGISSAYRL